MGTSHNKFKYNGHQSDLNTKFQERGLDLDLCFKAIFVQNIPHKFHRLNSTWKTMICKTYSCIFRRNLQNIIWAAAVSMTESTTQRHKSGAMDMMLTSIMLQHQALNWGLATSSIHRASSGGMQDEITAVEQRSTGEAFSSQLTPRMKCWRMTAAGAVSKIYKALNTLWIVL